MKLFRLTFSQTDLAKLPKEEQSFFLRLATVRDDVRSIDAFCLAAVNGLASENQLEQEAALHQLLLGIRLLCDILHEGWNVITAGWSQSALGRQFTHRLSPKAKHALKSLGRYFAKPNLVTTIRNHFAFHYDSKPLEITLTKFPAETAHAIISGESAGNVFYSFAEKVRNAAIVMATGKLINRETVWQVHDEAHTLVYPHFATFADAVLLEIAKSMPLTRDSVEVGTLYDPRTVLPPIFVDEEALKALASAVERSASQRKP